MSTKLFLQTLHIMCETLELALAHAGHQSKSRLEDWISTHQTSTVLGVWHGSAQRRYPRYCTVLYYTVLYWTVLEVWHGSALTSAHRLPRFLEFGSTPAKTFKELGGLVSTGVVSEGLVRKTEFVLFCFVQPWKLDSLEFEGACQRSTHHFRKDECMHPKTAFPSLSGIFHSMKSRWSWVVFEFGFWVSHPQWVQTWIPIGG